MNCRLILEVCHGAADAETLRAAVEFARLLGLDLHCLFIEDEAGLALAELPFARKIRLPTHEWSPLNAETIARELRQAASQMRRLLDEVLRGPPGSTSSVRIHRLSVGEVGSTGQNRIRDRNQIEMRVAAPAITTAMAPGPAKRRAQSATPVSRFCAGPPPSRPRRLRPHCMSPRTQTADRSPQRSAAAWLIGTIAIRRTRSCCPYRPGGTGRPGPGLPTPGPPGAP